MLLTVSEILLILVVAARPLALKFGLSTAGALTEH